MKKKKTEKNLSVLMQIQFQRLDIVLESQSGHRPQQIVAINGLSFLPLAFITGPRTPNYQTIN